jgi:hypothetical protein
MASTVQIWAATQLIAGAGSCKQYTGLTPAAVLGLIIANNSDLPLTFRQASSTVPIDPRTVVEIPTFGQQQYTLNVNIGAPTSKATDQYVTVQESTDPVSATTRVQLPVSTVSQFLNALGPPLVAAPGFVTGTYPIGPNVQTIVMFDKASVAGNDSVQVTGAQSGMVYYNGTIVGNPITTPLLVSVDPLLDNAIIFGFTASGGTSTLFCYGENSGLQTVSLVGSPTTQIVGINTSNGLLQAVDVSAWNSNPTGTDIALEVKAVIAAQQSGTPANVVNLQGMNQNSDGLTPLANSGSLAVLSLPLGFGAGVLDRLRTTQAVGDSKGHLSIGQSRLLTYSASIRAPARAYSLSHVFAGAGFFPWFSIWHTAAAATNLRIKMVRFWAVQFTAVVNVSIELWNLTSAVLPSGGAAIIPTAMHNNAAAPAATVLALPTVPGTVSNLVASHPFNSGVTGAGQTANPPTVYSDILLWPPIPAGNLEIDDPYLPALTAGGFCVLVDVDAACTVRLQAEIVFTEE